MRARATRKVIQHKGTDPENDNYWGSGKRWQKIFQAPPKIEFEKIVLATACSPKELNDLENALIGRLFEKDPLCMNLAPGGTTKFGKDNYFFDKHFVREANPFYGKHHSEQTRRLLAQKATGRRASEETRAKRSKALKGKPKSDTMRQRLSKARKGKCWLSKAGRQAIGESNRTRIWTDQMRATLSRRHSGRKWYNNGKQECLTFVCPEGFSLGRLKK